MTRSSRHKLFVLKRLGFHNPLERVYEDMRIVAIVKTPFELLYVFIHVLNRHLMKRPDERAFKQAPHAFNAVSVNITSYPSSSE